MNEKALAELSLRDCEYLNELLAKEAEALTPAERGHLVSRRDYLTKESQARFKINGAEKIELDSDLKVDNDYESMTVKELKQLCEDRGIVIDEKAKKTDIVDVLKADDNGELEEEE